MEYVAGASGAALGYIHNNVPGAITGYNLAKNLYQNSRMPVLNRNMGVERKRRASQVAGRVRRKKAAVYRRSGGTRLSAKAANMKTTDIKVTNKIPKLKKAKKVKISKKFKKAVVQALETKKSKGIFEERHYGLIQLDKDAHFRGNGYTGDVNATTENLDSTYTQNKQGVFQWASNSSWCFSNYTIDEFLDAAQVLFQNKIDRLKDTDGTPIGNYEFRHQDPKYMQAGWDLGGLMTTPFKVFSSSVTYNFRNNTQRAVTMHIHRLTPKQKIARKYEYYIKPPEQGLNMHLPIDAWYDWFDSTYAETCQALEPIDGDNTVTNVQPFLPIDNSVFDAANAVGYSIWYPGMSPRASFIMKNRYNIGTTRIVLQPGQVYTYVSHGPKNVNFDARQWSLRNNAKINPTNLYDGQDYCHKKPGWSEDLLITVLPDLLPKAVNAEGAGYYGINEFSNASQNQDVAIAVECIKRFHIECPDTATGITNAQTIVGGIKRSEPVLMNNNVPRKYYALWNYGAFPQQVGNVADRIDDENPVTKTNAED